MPALRTHLAVLVFLPALLVLPPRARADAVRPSPCDAPAARDAVARMLVDPKALEEPLELFHVALAQVLAGQRDQAEFLYLAASLRTARQMVFERGDRPQLATAMKIMVGPMIMPRMTADPERVRRAVEHTREWDRATSDPFRDRAEAKSGEPAQKMAEIDAAFAQMLAQLRDDPARVDRARGAGAGDEVQIRRLLDRGPGTLDPADIDAAGARIRAQVEALARTDPLVLELAHGQVQSACAAAFDMREAGLPGRISVAVTPAAGESFYVEIDAEATLRAARQLGALKTSLICVSRLDLGQRGGRRNDVCTGDPHALRPR